MLQSKISFCITQKDSKEYCQYTGDSCKWNTCKKRFEWELGGLPYGYDHKYIYSTIGYNLKATDIQASLGISQLQKLDSFIRKRKQNYEYLNEKFLMFEDYFKFVKINEKQDPSWFGFPLIIKINHLIEENYCYIMNKT